MDAEKWKRLEALFLGAVELPAQARAAFVETECGTDSELRKELLSLLRGDETGGDAFSRLEAHTHAGNDDALLGRCLGPYKLIERIAAGGMGVVYRAERVDGLFQHAVAIKLIRAERASEWMLRRFAFERRTLAALQHPCIARLYDGGTTDDGCPYIVMELVHGEPIDRYCQREGLPIAARLRLFLQVARAVHFAHQSLVVHCDLKPANILIDERGLPRLLDFGIARLLEDEADDATPAATRTIARVLTPEYASPEQLAGGAVTTALDVYALGVILYELATGRRPLESRSRSPAEWERLIREETPERPSSRVFRADSERDPASIARDFRSTPAGLRRALRGDLDRIVLMALRKEPERRYASVQELCDDLERHLAGQPVRARPSSLAYRGAKFVRRNRLALAAACAVLGALTFGLLAARASERVASAEALRATAEAQHARMEADSFQSLADFLMDAFLPVQPSQDHAWQERARERILAQADRVQRQYADNDHVRANLLDTLGHVCLRLDLSDDAERLMREALEVRERTFGSRSLEYALSLRSLGQCAYAVGDYVKAAALLREALDLHRAASSSTHADVAGLANDLAACLLNSGREADAEALHREALALRRDKGDGTLPVAESLNNLAGVHLRHDEHDLALAELREALSIRHSILGDEHLLTLQTMSNLAAALWRSDERAEALELLRRTESGYRALGGDGEQELGLVLANLATMQLETKDLDGAATSLAEALALQTGRLGGEHPLVAVTLAKLAALQHARHRDDEAHASWESVLRIRRAAQVPARELFETLLGYGVFLSDTNDWDQALPLIDEAVSLHRSQALDDLVALGRAEYALGLCCLRTGKSAAAREHLNEAARLLDAGSGVTADERARVRRRLAELD